MLKLIFFMATLAISMGSSSFASDVEITSHCHRHSNPSHCNEDHSGICYWDYNSNRCQVRSNSCYQIYDYNSCINSYLGCFWDDYSNNCQPNY